MRGEHDAAVDGHQERRAGRPDRWSMRGCATAARRRPRARATRVLVAYRDRSDKEIRDTSVVRFANGEWSAPVTVHADDWEINGCPVNGPVVTATGNAAAVAWFTGAGNTPKTLVAFSADARPHVRRADSRSIRRPRSAGWRW